MIRPKRMRNQIETIIAELKRRKAEGEEVVYIGDDTLARLRESLPRKGEAQKRVRETTPSPAYSKPVSTSLPKSRGKKTPYQSAPMPPPPTVSLPEGSREEQWQWLRERVLGSKVCRKHVKPGKKVVFGVGNLNADIFFCGEAPGADEEIRGEPFVGRAGQLLTRIIRAMRLRREDVYIGNIMNWRPEMPTAVGNRPPTQEEMNYCLPYLQAQLRIVRPKVLVALGATAVNGFLGPDQKRRMGAVRGKWFEFEGIPLLITYHPSYILRNGSNHAKRMIWEDMLKVMEKVGLPITEKEQSYFKNTP